MAVIFIDGFDKYGITGQNAPTYTTLIQQEWTTNSGGVPIAGLSGTTGYAIQFNPTNGGMNFIRSIPGNYSRLIGGVRIQTDLRTSVGVTFVDNITSQSSISINVTTGAISMRTGAINGTALATSSVTVTTNSIHYLEWDITFGTSAAYQVWLDGASLFSGTGATRSSGNSFANAIQFPGLGGANATYAYDDLYLFDSTGSYNNAVLLTSPRVETQYPTSDSQTQWTNAGNVLTPVGITQTGVANITATTNAPGAGQLALLKVTPAVNCTLNSVAMLPAATSASAKFKAVLYSDSAGAPNTLTSGSTTEVTGCTSGTVLTLAFNSAQSLTGGTTYWIGYITDTSVALSQYDNSTNLGQKKANTYASGAPAGPLSGMTTAQPTWEMWGVCTGATTNWESVLSNPANGAGPSADSSSISSSTSGNEDLYGYPALTTTPAVIHCVGVKANIKITGGAGRTIDLRCKSSSTDSAGSVTGITPGASYMWISSYFDRDPNGTIAWTKSAVDAATAGPKVAS